MSSDRRKVGPSIHSNCCLSHTLPHPLNHHHHLFPSIYLPQYTVHNYRRSSDVPHHLVWHVSSSCQCWSSHISIVCCVCLCLGHHQSMQQQMSILCGFPASWSMSQRNTINIRLLSTMTTSNGIEKYPSQSMSSVMPTYTTASTGSSRDEE